MDLPETHGLSRQQSSCLYDHSPGESDIMRSNRFTSLLGFCCPKVHKVLSNFRLYGIGNGN